MKKKIGLAVAAVVCVGLVVGLFYLFSNQRRTSVEDITELTEVQKLITENLEKNYPARPREVVKLYNRIITCFYGEDYTDEELEALGDQARMLFDDELLANNPRDEYFAALRAEIEEYRERTKEIVNSSVCASNDVKFQVVDGDECAYVTATYFISEDKEYSRTHHMYVLRKDEDGKWKILVFYQIEGDTSDE